VTNVLSANLVTDCYTQRRRENSPKSEKRYSTKIGTSGGSGEYYKPLADWNRKTREMFKFEEKAFHSPSLAEGY